MVRPGVPADSQPGELDPAAAAADAADRRQAEYFVRLLMQNRRLMDHRIDEYQQAIAAAEADGDADAAGNFRRLSRLEQQDRQSIDGMLEKLRKRFPRRSRGEVTALSPRARLAVR